MSDAASPWLTVAEAARFAKVSASTIRRAIRRQRLEAFRIGGGSAIRLHRDAVDAWLRSSSTLERSCRSWMRSVPAAVKNA